MKTLSGERCVACRRDSPRVTEAEIAELGREVSGWQVLERDGIARLERVFSFPNFADASASTKSAPTGPRAAGAPPSVTSASITSAACVFWIS
jgi:4a-hydroxytetrahydrobiopterin dehydratase